MPDDDVTPDAGDQDPTSTPVAGTGDGTDEDDAKPRRKLPVLVETGVLLVVALGMALIIKTLLVQAFYIPSGSMEPGLQINDRILVQKTSYWFGSPHRGDTVVFEDPGGWLTGPETGPQTELSKGLAKIGLYPTGGHLVKRVIGIGGDTVKCCNAKGQIMVNGKALDESDFIVKQDKCDGPMVDDCNATWSVTVPDDRLFVMGDNRSNSEDSSARYRDKCGGPQKPICEKALVPTDLVVGKLFALVWPLKHARFVGDPNVFDSILDPK